MYSTDYTNRLSLASGLLFYSSGLFFAMAAIGLYYLNSPTTAYVFVGVGITSLAGSAVIYRYKLGLIEQLFGEQILPSAGNTAPAMHHSLINVLTTSPAAEATPSGSDEEQLFSIQNSQTPSSSTDEPGFSSDPDYSTENSLSGTGMG